MKIKATCQPTALEELMKELRTRGYDVLGPTVRDDVIVYDKLNSVSDLPQGIIDEQEAGEYRLKDNGSKRYFGYTVGPHSWKKYLKPPVLKLWEAKKNKSGFEVSKPSTPVPKQAFFGVRACELQAIAIQDRVYLHGSYVDENYKSRRENVFIVAVNCSRAGSTCFCTSMGTGPEVSSGFDLAISEVCDEGEHYFVVEVGSENGQSLLDSVSHREAYPEEQAVAERLVEMTAQQMGRTLDTTNIKQTLCDNLEHPHWEDVASRCLSCANCTMVCPTCFCSTTEDMTNLAGDTAERVQKWDSCFSLQFSYIHGGVVRQSVKSRYRQWLTHKFATWIEQFGTSGCVGCGRCITWCPVGIDVTKEIAAIRDTE